MSAMSSKHLRRLLEEKEKAAAALQQKADEEEENEDEEEPEIRPAANKFAFFDDDGSGQEEKPSSDEEPVVSEPIQNRQNKKKNKKKKAKGGKAEPQKEIDEDEETMLQRLALEKEQHENTEANNLLEVVEIEQLFKVDPRMFDPSQELKRALGKAFKDASGQQQASRNQRKMPGRIVKQKPTWPPVKNIGLSMSLVKEENDIKWFKFEHNGYYENLERMCWLAEDSMDIGIVQEILSENYYHLNGLMMMANVYQMQEDVTQAQECIEMALFYCEQSCHALFQPTSWKHRLDFCDYENRAFFLLLHKYMMMCVKKRCFETALNIAKLLYSMDPQKDPMAVLLVIDSIAILARQHKWFADFYSSIKSWKNADYLPNIVYNIALSKFLSASEDADRIDASCLLKDAICAFPGVITQLIEELQIQPDQAVEYHPHLSVFALNKESEGLKVLFKIYVKQTAELWKAPETLAWLEMACRETAQDQSLIPKMEEWRNKRQRMFIGMPTNIRRLSALLGLDSSSSLTDPHPPTPDRRRYPRSAIALPQYADDGLLAGFLHSMFPNYNPEESLWQIVQRVYNEYNAERQPGPDNNAQE